MVGTQTPLEMEGDLNPPVTQLNYYVIDDVINSGGFKKYVKPGSRSVTVEWQCTRQLIHCFPLRILQTVSSHLSLQLSLYMSDKDGD